MAQQGCSNRDLRLSTLRAHGGTGRDCAAVFAGALRKTLARRCAAMVEDLPTTVSPGVRSSRRGIAVSICGQRCQGPDGAVSTSAEVDTHYTGTKGIIIPR